MHDIFGTFIYISMVNGKCLYLKNRFSFYTWLEKAYKEKVIEVFFILDLKPLKLKEDSFLWVPRGG